MMGRIRRTFRRMYMAITFTARTVRYISFRRRFRRNDHNNNNLLDILRNGEEFGLDQNQVNFWNLLNAGDEFDGYNNQLLLDIGMVHRRLEAADLSDEDDDGSHVLRPPHHHSYRGFIEKATGKVRLLSEMREIVGKPYYFGNIDRFEAEKIMTDLSNGSFLLRESKNPNKKLTITFRKDNLTLHARVEYSGGMFSCDNLDARFPRGPSVLQFIDECIRRRECHLYEPYVKVPVNRKNVLPLKMIAGASVVSLLKEANDIDGLELPTTLKNDLRGCSYPEICLMNSDRSILRPFLLGEDD
uniref:SH2 domain-containing protein n=1 Tax=Rhabditophanes sp. KR3021 TaxID=114890 RepID=A0AC35UDL6_9BILA